MLLAVTEPSLRAAAYLIVLVAATPTSAREPANRVSYEIEARLNARERILSGSSRVTIENLAAAPLRRVILQLEPNRYRDRFSTTAREQEFYHDDAIRQRPAGERGYLDIERVAVDGSGASFQILDTLLRVDLPMLVQPGDELVLEIDWFLKIRAHIGDSGHRDGRFEFAHWYPRVVYHDGRGWQAEPIHAATGPDAMPARYDVRLTLPRDLVVAATGQLVSGDPGWRDSRKRSAPHPRAAAPPAGMPSGSMVRTVRFRADDVPGFAWGAAPDLVCEERRAGPFGLRLLYPARRAAAWSSALDRAATVIEELGHTYGDLPYQQITVVEGLSANGATHPMLVFVPDPDELLLTRRLTSLWFGTAVSPDPIRSSWLERGLTAYAARKLLVRRHGPSGVALDDLGLWSRRLRRTSMADVARRRALRAARVRMDEPAATPAHRFRDDANRLPSLEDKASLLFDAVVARVGEEPFARAISMWLRENRLARVDGVELLRVLERETGQDLTALFTSWLEETGAAGVGIRGLRQEQIEGRYHVSVDVDQRGPIGAPVEVVVRTADGSFDRQVWSATEERATLEMSLDGPATEAWIDRGGVVFDEDRRDNRWPRRSELVWARPFQDYRPSDAYVVSVLDAKRGRVDFDLRYATPLRRLGRSELDIRFAKVEGRENLSAVLRTDLSPRLDRRPQSRFEVGLMSLRVRDPEYLREGRWDEGTVNQLWLGYGGEYAGPGWTGDGFVRYSVAGPQLDSDFTYNRFAASASFRAERRQTTWKLRTFLGLSSDGDLLPRQERFYLGGAGPMEELQNPGLRSRDSLLTLLNYHLPGDGNMRGYNDVTPGPSARRLFTINLEAEHQLLEDHHDGGFRRLIGMPSLAVFGDIGKAEGIGDGELDNALFSFGVGVRLERTIHGREFLFRLDFPFYVNRPAIDDGVRESRGAGRWVISIAPAL